ncbi:AMP-binding protein, partial [Parachlamydia acanthamoebae]|uniref:AMP-binding protein n=1 Tax=Parachlamydia acanthamoebae TaxID=83552 RepID=UPI00138E0418
LPIVILALWVLGVSFTPLDINQPSDRVAAIAKNASATLAITDEQSSQLLNANDIKLFIISDNQMQVREINNFIRFNKSFSMSDIAYTIYTSGTTGIPKGVEVQRRGLINIVNYFIKTLNLGFGNSCLAATTITFDISMLELFLVFFGVIIIFSDDEEAKCPKTLISFLGKYQVDLMQTTPSKWKMMLASEKEASWFLPKILCGGEPIDKKLAEGLLKHCNELYNVYGPTETTIWSSCAKITNVNALSIGKAVANTLLFILNDSLHCAPIGVPGEIYIGGYGLAKGYCNAADLTQQVFINPGNDFPYIERLYKTGDIACWDEEGNINYLYRKDQQIKLNGYRIELAEI